MARVGRFAVLSFLSLLVGAPALSAPPTIVTETKRGDFSFLPLAGYSDARLTNQTGQTVGFGAFAYGAQISLNIWDPVSFLLHYQYADGANLSDSRETFSQSSLRGGLMLGASSWLSIGVVYQVDSLAIDGVAGDGTKSASRGLGAGAVIDFLALSDSVNMNLQAWYSRGYAPASQYGNGAASMGQESAEIFLGLRWAPTVSFTYSRR